MDAFQALTAANQYALLGAFARSNHDRGRRGKP